MKKSQIQKALGQSKVMKILSFKTNLRPSMGHANVLLLAMKFLRTSFKGTRLWDILSFREQLISAFP